MTSVKNRSLKSGLICGAALFVLAMPVYAQPSVTVQKDLSEVLNNFATESNVEILFSPGLVKKRIAAEESYTGQPRESLSKILSGTGLSFEEPSPDVFIITEAATQPTPRQTIKESKTATKSATVTKSAQVQDGGAEPTVVSTDVPYRVDLEATPGVISGQVKDRISGQSLAGAIVLLEGSGRTTSTDSRGFYRFATAPVGEYKISVNYLGSEFQARQIAVQPGQAVTQNFSLGNALEELVVYGNRSSLQQALNQQRSASNSSTVVSSDLMGSFPAETISEALRRVSGVTFTRDAESGEGDRISVRGFNSQAINVQLNGIDLQGTGTDRSIDLSGFLTDNIKQVTIQKSLLPSQEATGSGGLVEIETRSGLDYGEKYFSVGLEREQSFAGGFGDEFEISGTGAYQLTDNFGVSATVQYRDTNAQNYDLNTLQTITPVLPAGFTSAFTLPESFNYPFDAAIDQPLYTGGNYFSRVRDESNLTMSLNFAYDWADHTRLRLDLQNIESDAEFSTSRTTASYLTSATDMPVPELGDEVRRRTYIRAFRPTLGIADTAENLKNRTLSFRGETDIDDWEFDYKFGISKVEKDRLSISSTFLSDINSDIDNLVDPNFAIYTPDDNAAMTPRLVGGGVGFASNGAPLLNLSSAGQSYLVDPASYYMTFASLADAKDTTDSYVLELDARKYFNNSVLDYIEVGGKYDDRKRSNSDDVLSTTNLTNYQTYSRIIGRNTYLADINANAFGIGDLSDIGVAGAGVPFITPGTGSTFIDGIANLIEDDPNTAENEARFTFTDRRDASPIDVAGAQSPALITEKIFAGYVESKAILGDFELVGGVRYQREERTGTAISTPSIRLDEPGFSNVPRETFIAAGLIDFVDTASVQETWTPSVIANYRPSDEMVVRGAYFRSTVHPGIEKIARPQTVLLDLRPDFARATIREPNPNLDPSTTDNFDLDFSYYFQDNPGLIRLGVFYKKISNNFTSTLLADEATGDDLRQRVLDILSPLTAIDPALTALPENAEYFLQQPRNGEGGDIYGFEAELIRQLDFMPQSWPSFIENFSVLGNVTYTKSSFNELESARDDDGNIFTLTLEDRPMIGQSEWAGNASLRYEDGPFSGSVIYTYQSASATSYDEFNLNGITPEFDTLDLRLSYTLQASGNRPMMVFFAEGDDLLTSADEADIRAGIGSQFGDGDVDYFFPTSRQFNGGRRFTVGARMTF